jgi:ubiquitin-associated SH3 domain-containing protein
LFSHVGDPFLDDPLPREYVLYLRPTGPLAQKLSDFWQQSKQICGKNKAHNIFPHITLCQFFMVSCGPPASSRRMEAPNVPDSPPWDLE